VNTLDCSGDELRVIKEALLKARAQSETEGFETEKCVIDSFRVAPNENVSAAIQDMYDRLLRKIQSAIDHS
jgi:hypothetical protein